MFLFIIGNIEPFHNLIDEIGIDLPLEKKCDDEFNTTYLHLLKKPIIHFSEPIDTIEDEYTHLFKTKILINLFSGIDLLDPPDFA